MRDLILGTFQQILKSMSNSISCNCGIPSSINLAAMKIATIVEKK